MNDNSRYVAMFGVFLIAMSAMLECESQHKAEWRAERAKPSIHNNAGKCRRHCHNAGLRVTSWDGAYPDGKTQHGCRCGE